MIDKIKPNKKSSFNIKKISENFYKSINDDFNTPVLFANIFEAVKLINLCISERETLNKKDKNELKNLMNLFIKDILGLQNSNINKSDD